MEFSSVEFEKLLKDQELKNQNLMLVRLKQYEETIQEKDNKIQSLITSLDNLKINYKECCDLIDERDKDISILESNYDNVLQIINVKEEEINTLSSNIRKLEEKNLEDRRNFQIAEESYKVKISKASCYNKEKLNALSIENNNYKDTINKLNETINYLNSNSEELSSRLQASYNDIDNLSKEYEACQNNLNSYNKRVINLENENQDIKTEKNELINELNSTKKENANLQKIEFEFRLKQEMLENTINEKSNEIQLIKNKCKNLTEENMTLKIDKQNFEFQVKELKEVSISNEKEMKSMNEKIFLLIEEKSSLELNNSKMTNELKLLKMNFLNKSNEYETLKDENQLIKDDYAKIKYDKDNILRENKSLKDRIAEIEGIMSKYNELKVLFEKNIIDKSNILRENNELKEITERLTSRLSELNTNKNENFNYNDANNLIDLKNDNFNRHNEMYIVDSNYSVDKLDKLNEYFLHSTSENNDYLDNIETFGERKPKVQTNYKDIINSLKANLTEKTNEISGLQSILQNIQEKILSITKEYEEEKEKYIMKIKNLEIELEAEKLNKNLKEDLFLNVNKNMREESLEYEIKKLKMEREKLSNLCQSQRNKISKLENNLIFLKSDYDQYKRIFNEDSLNKIKSEIYSRNSCKNENLEKSKFHSFSQNIPSTNTNNNFNNTCNLRKTNNNFSNDLESNIEERKKRILNRDSQIQSSSNENYLTNKIEIDRFAKESLRKLNYNNILPFTDVRDAKASQSKEKTRSLSGSKSTNKITDLSNTINIRKIVYDIDTNQNKARKYSQSKSRSNSNSRPKSAIFENYNGKFDKISKSIISNKKTFKLIK